jgi:hypothetical protein
MGLVSCLASVSLGQTTGTPSFNAPYRAFTKHEFGGTLSFPSNSSTLLPGANYVLEGQYRFGYQKFDLGFRGGFADPGGGADKVFLIGAEGRSRMITHTENFPLDGALIVGLAGDFVSGSSAVIMSGGLSLGRRIDPKGSEVSIVPYGEPVLLIVSGGGQTKAHFALGLGGDFRLSKAFDVRASIGLGDIEGIAFSAVWVH